MKALLPHQPVTTAGHLPSRELLEAMQQSRRDERAMVNDIAGKAPLVHSHLAADLTDFAASARAQVEATLVAGTNITLTPAGSGETRTITVAAAGGGSSVSPIIYWAI